MSDSKQLVVPDDEPWMSHAFVSKIAAQVSLPYRRPKAREIVKRNGDLEVRFICGADCLPYGKYPRLFELWACTMIKSRNECWNPETMTLSIGKSFRDFLELLNVNVGGKSLRTIKPQLESLFKCAYIISYNTKTNSKGANFTVAKALEHNVRTSDGMNWNLQDLVYEALSEEWRKRDGEISDPWANDEADGYQPPSYEPVDPERRTAQTPSDGLI